MNRRIWLILTLTLISFSVNAQIAVIEYYRNNILYVGLANPLKATIINEDCQSFFLTATNGTLEGECSSFLFKPNKPGNAIISFNRIIDGDTVILDRKEFIVKRLPSPTAKVYGLSNGEISKQTLAVQIGIVAEFEGFDIDLQVDVKSFRTIILRGEKIIFNEVNQGKRFTDITMKGLRSIQAGDIVYFVSITGAYPNLTEIPMNSIEFRIIE